MFFHAVNPRGAKGAGCMFSSKSPIKRYKNVITNTHDTIKKTVGENGWVAADDDTAVSCISIQKHNV